MTAEILRVLENNHVFCGLSGDLIRVIAASASKKTLGSNEMLFRKGDRANAMWGVLSGRIVTQVRADDGKELVLDAFEAGDVFGEVGVLDFGPRPVDAIAETRTELFRLERRQFLNHLQSSPELCFRIFSLLCSDLRETTEALEDSVLYTLPGRLAKKLVNLVNHIDRDATDNPLTISISHNELARLLGVHRVSISRQLSQWEKAGLIASGRQKIEILNLQAVVNLSAPGQAGEFGNQDWDAVNIIDLHSSGISQGENFLTRPLQSAGPEYRGILAVDAAEYSQSLLSDAAGTFKQLKAGMHAIDKAISDGGGRLISHSGDRVLADFPGAGEAYHAALAIHEKVDGLSILGSSSANSTFRIGVHYGAISSARDGYLGEAANIAIRLTGLSGTGGVCLSGQAREKLDLPDIPELQFLGDHELKNVSRPIAVYSARAIPKYRVLALRAETLVPRRFRLAAITATFIALLLGIWFTADRMGQQRALPAVSQLSIAVLPFTSSGDPAFDYLARGIPNEIGNVLSTVSGMRVIGRESVSYFDQHTASAREIGQALDVDWLLRGDLTSSGEQVSVTTQLINATNSEVVWEGQFRDSQEGFDGFAPEIIQHIANSLGITGAEGGGLPQLVSLTSNSQARALYLEAQGHLWLGRQRFMINAVPLLQMAVELDPSFAEAHAVLTGLYLGLSLLDEQEQYNPDIRQQLARQSLQQALALKPDSPLVLAEASKMRFRDEDYEGALALAQRALKIDPNNTEALQARYWVHWKQQEWPGALQTSERLMRLEPMSMSAMTAHWTELNRADRHQDGLAVARRALTFYPENEVTHAHSWAAASQLGLGDRLGAIESSKKGMPYGSPYDLWTGLDYEWEFFDDLDPLRSIVGLVYVEEYDRIRQILINNFEPVSGGVKASVYLGELDYLINRGELEALVGDFEAAMGFFEQARLLAGEEGDGLVRVTNNYAALDWSRQSHWALALLLAHRKTGQHEAADIIAGQIEDMTAEFIEALATVSTLADYRNLYAAAQFYAIEGRNDEALEKLRTWVDYNVDIFTYIKWDPYLDSLRGDPRFEAIVAEVEVRLAGIRAQYHANQVALHAVN